MEDGDEEQRKIFCGNLDERVDEELLYELFIQAGPVEKVTLPGGGKDFAFIVYKHECSVAYALELFEDTTLFGKTPRLRVRRSTNHHRTQSAPAKFAQDNTGYGRKQKQKQNTQMNFDHLLQLSQSFKNTQPKGQHQGLPYIEMPPSVGGHFMGMPPPMGGQFMRIPPPMGVPPPMVVPPSMGVHPPMGVPPHMVVPPPMGVPPLMGVPPPMGGQFMGLPPAMGGPHMGMPPPMSGPHMGMSPATGRWSELTPPGEEKAEDSRKEDSLSRSSLQGNWSARNSSHMLPYDDSRRSGNNARRERPYDRDSSYYRGNDFHHRGGGQRNDDLHHRDRRDRYDRRDERDGHSRSRSNDVRERGSRF